MSAERAGSAEPLAAAAVVDAFRNSCAAGPNAEPYRGLRRHRQLRNACADRPRRLHRLAVPAPIRQSSPLCGAPRRTEARTMADRVPAPIRQSSLLCGAPRRTEARTMADRTGDRRRPGDAPLFGRHARSRDRVPDRKRRRMSHRLYGAAGGRVRRRPPRPRSSGRRRHAHGAHRALRLRRDRPVGLAAGGRAAPVCRWPGSAAPGHERRNARRRLPHPGGVHRLGRTGDELRPQLVPVLRLGSPGAARGRRAGAGPGVLVKLGDRARSGKAPSSGKSRRSA